MPRITILRHGQASFFGPDYDALSPLGRRQARELGRFWAESGMAWDRVFVGPRARHLQTLDEVAVAYQELGRPWPAPILLEDLDEHQGLRVVARVLGYDDLHAAAMRPTPTTETDRDGIARDYFRRYRDILRQWVDGELAMTDVESFAAFRVRTARALQQLASAQQDGERVLAFSSGGFASMALATVLGIGNRQVLDLSMLLRNCALTEFLASGPRLSLLSFNVLPHVVSGVGETWV